MKSGGKTAAVDAPTDPDEKIKMEYKDRRWDIVIQEFLRSRKSLLFAEAHAELAESGERRRKRRPRKEPSV